MGQIGSLIKSVLGRGVKAGQGSSMSKSPDPLGKPVQKYESKHCTEDTLLTIGAAQESCQKAKYSFHFK